MYICDRSLSGDPSHSKPFSECQRAYPSVTQHTVPTKSQLKSPSVCPCLIQVSTKLLIEKGYLNLIHNQNSYQHFNSISTKTKLDKIYNEM